MEAIKRTWLGCPGLCGPKEALPPACAATGTMIGAGILKLTRAYHVTCPLRPCLFWHTKRGQVLIIQDDPHRREEVTTANRNKACAPFQYVELQFAALAVVKSRTGLRYRFLQWLKSAYIHECLKSTILAARVAPFMHKASRCHVNLGASQQYCGFRDLHAIMCSFWSRLRACRPHYGSMEQENAALGVLVHALDLHL